MSRKGRTIEQLSERLVQARRGGNERLCARLRVKIRNKTLPSLTSLPAPSVHSEYLKVITEGDGDNLLNGRRGLSS
jgi:hypothetical protein